VGSIETNETVSLADAGQLRVRAPELPIVAATTYTILDEHARGGIGRVMRARDERTGRIVAIKEMLSVDPAIEPRFVREALVTANLQHPAIVPVYEIARWPNGQPFYAMKLVAGMTLTDAIARAKELRDRLALIPHVAAVADALAYAHGAGVIHRDLKPSNVLVGAFGETVVIDWGLAKRTDDDIELPLPEIVSAETVSGAVLGTPTYMPPEQAAGAPVDARADVYAIGAMLYHVLSSWPPYGDAKDSADVIARKRQGVPPIALAALATGASPDLLAIVDKAMSARPAERYPTARELADDLHAFMTGGLVGAHRYTMRQRFARWVRRNRTAVAVGALASVALVAFGGYSIARIVDERDRARAADARSSARLETSYEDRARVELVAGRPERALPLAVEAFRLGRDTPALRFLLARIAQALPTRVATRAGELTAAAFVPKSHEMILYGPHGVVRWDADRDRVVWSTPDIDARTGSDPDLAGRLALDTPGGIVLVDVATGKKVATVPFASPRTARFVDIQHDVLVAVADDSRVAAWNIRTLAPLATVPALGNVQGVTVAPDGRRAVIRRQGFAPFAPTTLVDLVTGATLAELCPDKAPCSLATYGPHGELVLASAIVDRDGTGWLGVVADDGTTRWQTRYRGTVAATAFVGDDLVIATDAGSLESRALADGTVRWQRAVATPIDSLGVRDRDLIAVDRHAGLIRLDPATGNDIVRYSNEGSNEATTISDDLERVAGVTYASGVTVSALAAPADVLLGKPNVRASRIELTRDGAHAIVGSSDGDVAIYATASAAIERAFHAHDGGVATVTVDRAGAIVATGGRDGTATLWDLATGRALRSVTHGKVQLQFASISPDGRLLATGARDGSIKRWNVATGEPIGSPLGLGPPTRTGGWRPLLAVRWSPAGDAFAAIDEDGFVTIWDARTGAELRRLDGGEFGHGFDVLFSPDGRYLAVSRHDAHPKLLEVRGDRDIALADDDRPDQGYRLAFDHAGTQLAMPCIDGRVRIWDPATGARLATLETRRETFVVAFSVDDALVITGDQAGWIRVWEAATGDEIAARAAPGRVFKVEPTSRGDAIVVTTDKNGLLWRVPALRASSADLDELARCRSSWRIGASGGLVQGAIDLATCR
jgi:WD40 repeat protein/tRNA A-37 threonylcarbamoyl transferase component Bud32